MKLIRRPLAPGETDLELLFAGVLIAAAGVVWLLFATGIPLPGCPLKAACDLPCVGCGSTRAVRAMMGGNVLSAFTLNPLTSLTVLAGVAWLVYAVSVAGRRVPRWRVQALTKGSRWLLWILVAANWAYILYRHG